MACVKIAGKTGLVVGENTDGTLRVLVYGRDGETELLDQVERDVLTPAELPAAKVAAPSAPVDLDGQESRADDR